MSSAGFDPRSNLYLPHVRGVQGDLFDSEQRPLGSDQNFDGADSAPDDPSFPSDDDFCCAGPISRADQRAAFEMALEEGSVVAPDLHTPRDIHARREYLRHDITLLRFTTSPARLFRELFRSLENGENDLALASEALNYWVRKDLEGFAKQDLTAPKTYVRPSAVILYMCGAIKSDFFRTHRGREAALASIAVHDTFTTRLFLFAAATSNPDGYHDFFERRRGWTPPAGMSLRDTLREALLQNLALHDLSPKEAAALAHKERDRWPAQKPNQHFQFSEDVRAEEAKAIRAFANAVINVARELPNQEVVSESY